MRTPRLPLGTLLGLPLALAIACGGASPKPPSSAPAGAPSSSTASVCPGSAPAEAALAQAPSLTVDSRHSGEVVALASSPRGYLATASSDGTVRLWDVAQHALLRTIPLADLDGFRELAWNAEGSRLTVLGAAASRTIDLAGRVVEKLPRETRAEVAQAGARRWLSVRDGLPVLVGDDAKAVGKFSLPSGVKGSYFPSAIALSRDGSTLAVAEGEKQVAIFSLGAPDTPARVVAIDAEKIAALALSVDGRQLAVVATKSESRPSSFGGALRVPAGRVWIGPTDGATALQALDGVVDHPQGVALSPDGKRVAAATSSDVVVWSVAKRALAWRRSTNINLEEMHKRVTFSGDGARVVTGGNGGALRVYGAETGRSEPALGAPTMGVRWVGLVPSSSGALGSLVALEAGRFAEWSLPAGTVARRQRVSQVAFASLDHGDVMVARTWGSSSGELRPSCRFDELEVAIERWHGLDAPAGSDPDAADDDRPPPMLLDGSATAAKPTNAPTAKPDPAARERERAKMTWPAPRGAAKHLCLAKAQRLDDVDFERGVLAVSDSEGTSLVDVKTGARTALADYDANKVFTAKLSSNGKWVSGTTIGFGLFGRAAVWEAATGKLAGTYSVPVVLKSESGGLTTTSKMSGAFTATVGDDDVVYVGYGDELAAFEVRGGGKKWQLTLPSSPRSLTSPQPGVVVVGGLDGSLQRVREGAIDASATGDGGTIEWITPHASAGLLASIGRNGALRLWREKDLSPRVTLVDFSDDEQVAFTPGGAYVGTREVAERIGWVFVDPTERFGFGQFEARFSLPATVEKRLKGEDVDAAAWTHRPPKIDALDVTQPAAGSAHLHAVVSAPVRVDRVRVWVEGREVADKAVCAARGELDLDVPLVSGLNRVTLQPFDASGFAGNARVFDVVDSSVATLPDVWVLAAGVSQYPKLGAAQQLRVADADALAIGAAMSAQVSAGTFAKAHVKTLTDGEVTRASIEQALTDMQAMKPEDLAIVFLAGHGVQSGPAGEMSFLSSESSISGGAVHDAIAWTALSGLLEKLRGRVVVLLDACHSGDITREAVVANEALARSLGAGGRAGIVVFAASKGRQVSFEGNATRGLRVGAAAPRPVTTTGEHGFFTGALLGALTSKETDSNQDGQVQLSELFDAVTQRVTMASEGQQTPFVARREIFGDFRIARVAR